MIIVVQIQRSIHAFPFNRSYLLGGY